MFQGFKVPIFQGCQWKVGNVWISNLTSNATICIHLGICTCAHSSLNRRAWNLYYYLGIHLVCAPNIWSAPGLFPRLLDSGNYLQGGRMSPVHLHSTCILRIPERAAPLRGRCIFRVPSGLLIRPKVLYVRIRHGKLTCLHSSQSWPLLIPRVFQSISHFKCFFFISPAGAWFPCRRGRTGPMWWI